MSSFERRFLEFEWEAVISEADLCRLWDRYPSKTMFVRCCGLFDVKHQYYWMLTQKFGGLAFCARLKAVHWFSHSGLWVGTIEESNTRKRWPSNASRLSLRSSMLRITSTTLYIILSRTCILLSLIINTIVIWKFQAMNWSVN